MNEIDWRQAPEWANVRIRNHATPNLMAWAESYTEDVKFLRDDSDGAVCPRLAVGCWELVAARPTTPSWSGEGLPPVGVHVEWYSDVYGWLGGKVIGHDGAVAVVSHNDGYTGCHLHNLKPTRTPEQIAADEREAAIDRMCKIAAAPHMLRRHAEALYDAGYRKP